MFFDVLWASLWSNVAMPQHVPSDASLPSVGVPRGAENAAFRVAVRAVAVVRVAVGTPPPSSRFYRRSATSSPCWWRMFCSDSAGIPRRGLGGTWPFFGPMGVVLFDPKRIQAKPPRIRG